MVKDWSRQVRTTYFPYILLASTTNLMKKPCCVETMEKPFVFPFPFLINNLLPLCSQFYPTYYGESANKYINNKDYCWKV